MKAIILTEGSNSKGFGHIERCKGLYDELMAYGIKTTLVIDTDDDNLKVLDGYSYIIKNWKEDNLSLFDRCYVIVDSYYLTDKLIDDITSHFYRTLFIDDLNKIPYKNAIVVNPSIYGEALNYPIKDDVKYLIGEDYVMLRKPFRKHFNRVLNEKISTITVTMGGSDVKNLTPVILDSLSTLDDVKINVIAGNGYNNIDEIQKYMRENMTILKNLSAEEMSEIFEKSDLVISACGQTIFELIQTNTISIMINVIDNQVYNEKYIKENDLGIVLKPEDIKNKLVPTIKSLNSDLSIRQNILSNLSKISFEKGVYNIISEFIDKLILKKAVMEDAKTLYDWRNSKLVRDNSFNNYEIDFESHKKWLENKLDDDNCYIYIAYLNDEKIGQIRTDFSDGAYEISYSIDEKYIGRGFGKQMLKVLEEEFINSKEPITLTGKVKISNERSASVFERMRYSRFEKDGYYKFTKTI